jgi:hypothetical protein
MAVLESPISTSYSFRHASATSGLPSGGTGLRCDNVRAMPLRPLVAITAAASLGACALRGPDEAQQVVNSRTLGVSSGDFFQRYGRPAKRYETPQGIYVFDWEGGTEHMAAGVIGQEDKVCRLRLTTDKNGRIETVEIVRDAKGERRLSRCAELFDH